MSVAGRPNKIYGGQTQEHTVRNTACTNNTKITCKKANEVLHNQALSVQQIAVCLLWSIGMLKSFYNY